jgi:hypothetical protein
LPRSPTSAEWMLGFVTPPDVRSSFTMSPDSSAWMWRTDRGLPQNSSLLNGASYPHETARSPQTRIDRSAAGTAAVPDVLSGRVGGRCSGSLLCRFMVLSRWWHCDGRRGESARRVLIKDLVKDALRARMLLRALGVLAGVRTGGECLP